LKTLNNKQSATGNGQLVRGVDSPVARCLLSVFYCLLSISLLTGCSVSKTKFSPSKKYSPEQLQKDYSVFRGALEESHPGIYWYTSKNEMDNYFSRGESQLHDSLTEEGFRKVLSFVIAKINCGHTVVRSSKAFSRYRDTTVTNVFPLSLKIWPGNNPLKNDTAAVATNLIRKDTLLKRGVVIKKINNQPLPTILDTLCQYISSDGYNLTHKFQTLSNRGGFGSAFTSLFGAKENYYIDFIDSAGEEKSAAVPAYNPRADSFNRTATARFERSSRPERKKQFRQSSRSFRIDSTNKTGFMDLSSFGRNLNLKKFFRSSFRKMHRSGVTNLVVDVRGNGGGSVSNSTVLAKFIVNKKFKVADSLYAVNRNSRYKKYIENYFFTRLFMRLMTARKKDGRYHFGYFERHYFKPKKKNHFDGNVYVLTGGNSFSATTLFTQTIIQQPNVTVVGEETGGGAYGNTAWLIPNATLPETGVRFRLPLFRMVINKNIPKDGRGIQPEVEVKPTVGAIRRGVDYKMEKVMELIRNNQ
jgi:hypothetical protein